MEFFLLFAENDMINYYFFFLYPVSSNGKSRATNEFPLVISLRSWASSYASCQLLILMLRRSLSTVLNQYFFFPFGFHLSTAFGYLAGSCLRIWLQYCRLYLIVSVTFWTLSSSYRSSLEIMFGSYNLLFTSFGQYVYALIIECWCIDRHISLYDSCHYIAEDHCSPNIQDVQQLGGMYYPSTSIGMYWDNISLHPTLNNESIGDCPKSVNKTTYSICPSGTLRFYYVPPGVRT